MVSGKQLKKGIPYFKQSPFQLSLLSFPTSHPVLNLFLTKFKEKFTKFTKFKEKMSLPNLHYLR